MVGCFFFVTCAYILLVGRRFMSLFLKEQAGKVKHLLSECVNGAYCVIRKGQDREKFGENCDFNGKFFNLTVMVYVLLPLLDVVGFFQCVGIENFFLTVGGDVNLSKFSTESIKVGNHLNNARNKYRV
jgi:hypothetical protein